MITPAVIIGGMFGLEPMTRLVRYRSLIRSTDRLFVNARSAINTLLAELQSPRVWLPSYLCESLITACSTARDIQYFGVDEHLRPDRTGLLDGIQPGDVAILIRYFGWPLDGEFIDAIHQRGGIVLEDASQAFLYDEDSQAEFTVFSPRKFVGVSDGGVLIRRRQIGECTTLEPPPTEWLRRSQTACRLRADFDLNPSSSAEQRQRWFDLFREVELTAPCGPISMSQHSKRILEQAVDPKEVSNRRIENYTFLAAELAEWALLGNLPVSCVPLAFPMVTDHRDALQQALAKEGIFAPIHWPVPPAVPSVYSASRSLSARILSIPCDQRMDTMDVARVVEAIKRCLH